MANYEQKYPISSQKVKFDVNVMKNLMEDLERGQNSTHMVRNIVLQHYSLVKLEDSYNNNNNNNNNNNHHDYLKALDYHSMVAIEAYANSVATLQNLNFNLGFVENRKRNDPCKSVVSSDQSSPKYNKRRKISGESKEKEVTHLTDDGFVWRKYGQKMIQDYQHPRHYYRCTHKNERNCEATKQIQQVSENPTKYKLIYNKNHTCNHNIINTTSSYMINSTPDDHPSSAILLSLDGSNPVNPMMFSPLFNTTVCDDTKTSETSSSSSKTSFEESENTSTVIDAKENNSSSSTSLDLDEDYNAFIAEFYEIFPDL